MAAIAQSVDLSFEEFVQEYESSEPRYEYLEGELVPKPMASWIHGLVQPIIGNLLLDAGYFSGSEITCKMERHYPVPDIAAVRSTPDSKYAVQPPDVVLEILSDEGEKSRLMRKLDRYAGWGCPHVYVVDPATQRVFRWVADRGLLIVQEIVEIPAARVWEELARRLNSLGQQ